jgi:putative PIN family toxin of toxin-antitoxin system
VSRAVLDTNVIVSGFIRPQGPPGRLLAMLVEHAFEMILSSEMLGELQEAVRYPRVRDRISLSDEELDLRLAMLDTLSIPVEPKALTGVADDPNDDKVMAAAVEGRAEFVVAGDGGLRRIGEYEGIRIVSPAVFLELLTRS